MTTKINDRSDEQPVNLTPEALEMIDEAEKSFADGKGYTSEQARAFVRQKAAEWLTQDHQSA